MRTHNRSYKNRLKFDRDMQKRADRADDRRRKMGAIIGEQRALLLRQNPDASVQEIEDLVQRWLDRGMRPTKTGSR